MLSPLAQEFFGHTKFEKFSVEGFIAMSFIKGLFIGLLLGAGVGVMLEMTPSHRKSGKKMLGRAIKHVGQVVEGVSCALGI